MFLYMRWASQHYTTPIKIKTMPDLNFNFNLYYFQGHLFVHLWTPSSSAAIFWSVPWSPIWATYTCAWCDFTTDLILRIQTGDENQESAVSKPKGGATGQENSQHSRNCAPSTSQPGVLHPEESKGVHLAEMTSTVVHGIVQQHTAHRGCFIFCT